MMPNKGNQPGGRFCPMECEYRWEDRERTYCLYGLVHNVIEDWRTE